MTNRRDFIKWVLYLGAAAQLPKLASPEKIPTDVLEGISWTKKKMADLSGNAARFRASEDTAFERAMQDAWRQANGKARYIRTVEDRGVQPAHTWYDVEGTAHDIPESYVTTFQYRRA